MEESPQSLRAIDRLLWLKILIGGCVLFFLVKWGITQTGNINYIPSLLVVGSCTVPLSFLVLLYSRNKVPYVSMSNLLTCLVWGGVLGTVLAGRLEYAALLRLGTLPTLVIGIVEELAKLIVPALFIIGKRKRSEIDSIVIGAASGAGFAVLESMGYGLTALLLTQGNVNATIQQLLVRGLLSPAAHIAWTALITCALWRATHHVGKHPVRRFIYTFVAVAVLHSLWDGTAISGAYDYLLVGLISLVWLVWTVYKAGKRAPSSRNVPIIATTSD